MKKGLLLILRGLPASGKTTLANEFIKNSSMSFASVDSDQVDNADKSYRNFTPKMTKNPSPNVKMYSYLFNRVVDLLHIESNVIWQQPWTRFAEIKLTIQNLGYYFTNLGENVWSEDLNNILKKLPFKVLIVQINITAKDCIRRCLLRSGFKDIDRLNKTIWGFQKINLNIPALHVNGTDPPNKNARLLIEFVENQRTQKNAQRPKIEKNA